MDARTVLAFMDGTDGLNFSNELREMMLDYCDSWTENYPAYVKFKGKSYKDGGELTLQGMIANWMEANCEKFGVSPDEDFEDSCRDFASNYEYDGNVVMQFIIWTKPELTCSTPEEIEDENTMMLGDYGFLFEDFDGYTEIEF